MNERGPINLQTQPEHCPPPASFDQLCRDFGVELESTELENLERFLGLLLANNRHMNLTAIRDAGEAWRKHIFDGLTPLCLLHQMGDNLNIADLGSGGGVPAIPLAITHKKTRFTLIESTEKKTHYLRMLTQELQLPTVDVLTSRAELVGQDTNYRERFDIVTARALGELRLIVEYAIPLLKVGGKCLFIKGGRADDELRAARRALHVLHTRHVGNIETPTGTLVVLEKRQSTPKKYPRGVGEPKRAPL